MKIFFYPVFAILLLGSSCQKDENKSTLSELIHFSLVEIDVAYNITANAASAMVPAGSILDDRTMVFEISEKAKAFIENREVLSGTSKHSFATPVELTVVAENGNRTSYLIITGFLPNKAPVANAGENQILFLDDGKSSTLVNLDGSKSYKEDGEIIEYTWKYEDEVIGTEPFIVHTFQIGRHSVLLTVKDEFGSTAQDEVIIDVREVIQYIPVDPNATQETRSLLINLGKIANGPEFIFGQEFPMSFQLNNLRWNLNTSDCKDVVGDHPGVFGIDPHYMLYKGSQQRDLHIQEARYAYENGAVVTFDFHQESRFDNSIYMNRINNELDKSLMYDIVNDQNGSRQWFFEEMDIIIDIINNELGFPIVFRLFHEMNGGWFWWGTNATNHSPQLYIDFFRLSVDYIRDRTNLVLFSWSPNHPFGTTYYPGNDYVDVVGVDIYEPSASQLTSLLKQVSDFALENNKIAALTEVGNRDNYISNHPDFWTNTILKAIKDGGDDIRIAWVLAWFNAPWTSTQNDLFIPNSQSPQAAKNDFKKFHKDKQTMFLNEVRTFKMYD
ncbi:glycosyl hydrolase [Natronoflexus pectinivorans]|uniref:Glycosyl hydrolase family 26 n=1 Tax=Natronoflexus pectinivorans TaxID=682526 RepID=A0A4V2RWI1_9BACT|nr:glycosyl hydrolase [Natronoflexus pectinivorans]TCO08436.1 glycosyl hydrolase family 26 [Natronoflexus pectinivorans]